MFWNKSIRRQEINYAYSDANLIPQINKYLMECKLEMKLLKLSWDIMNAKVKIIFKSNFKVRIAIADKLREFDSDSPVLRMKRQFYLNKETAEKEKERYETPLIDDEEIEVNDNERIKIGDVVKHFKGGKYLVLEFAKHTETSKKMVIYQSMYGDKEVFARPYNMFMDKIDKKKYPDNNQEYRFEVYDPMVEEDDNDLDTREELMDFAKTTEDGMKNIIGKVPLLSSALSNMSDDEIKAGLEKI